MHIAVADRGQGDKAEVHQTVRLLCARIGEVLIEVNRTGHLLVEELVRVRPGVTDEQVARDSTNDTVYRHGTQAQRSIQCHEHEHRETGQPQGRNQTGRLCDGAISPSKSTPAADTVRPITR